MASIRAPAGSLPDNRSPELLQKLEKGKIASMYDLRQGMHQAAQSLAEMNQTNIQVDFAQFSAYMRSALKLRCTDEQMRQLFASTDENGDGEISLDEFFVAALVTAVNDVGIKALEDILFSVDEERGQTGLLDELEFEKLCDTLGFRSNSATLFSALCRADGLLSVADLNAKIKSLQKRAPLLRLPSAEEVCKERERLQLHLKGKAIGLNAVNATVVCDQLRDALASSGAQVR